MQPADRIRICTFNNRPMRAFHCTWVAFLVCFFAWFAIAPLMPEVRKDLGLSKDQVANCIIASVAATILARFLFGWLCDRIGPRISYSMLMILGAIPVIGIAFCHSYLSFLIARLAIGVIGASFVITQYHASRMFSPSCVGTANAAAAGWGNLGGGAANMLMPLILAAACALTGFAPESAWRWSMLVPGVLLILCGIAYAFLTVDSPNGNFSALRRAGLMPPAPRGGFWSASGDMRVWLLFLLYGACFGIELVIDNYACLYFHDDMGCSVAVAGVLGGLVGGMNIVARALGGFFADRFGKRFGLRGRTLWLGALVFGEGIALAAFGLSGSLWWAIPALALFGACVCMACGATYAVVPFINARCLGSVSGIVGAGGSFGALAAGFLFKIDGLSRGHVFAILGVIVALLSFLALAINARPDEVSEKTLRAAPELDLVPA